MARQDKLDQVLTKLAVMDERDQNTAKDIEAIQKTLSVVVQKNQQQDEKLNRHDQTLYGEDGKNGMKGYVSTLSNRVRGLERKSYIAHGIVVAFVALKEYIFGGGK
jgi:hypothetical protein